MAVLARLLALLVAALAFSAPAATAAGRPPHPHVAAGVRTISIRSESGASVRVTRASTVATIVRWFNALRGFRPRPCPLLVHEPAAVTFKFFGPGNALTHAVDRNPGTCDGAITYGNNLQVRYPTLADDHFVERVSRLLGVDLEPSAKTAANERAARRDAIRLLRLAIVPPGSHVLARATGSAASTPGTTALVDRHRTWRVRMPLDSVAAFETAHRPKGSRQTEQGTGADRGVITSHDLTFTFPPRAGISSRELVVDMTRLKNGWTGIPVDAQDTWVVARPSWEVVPHGVTEIDVRKAGRLLHRVRDARKIATIVRWFDALQVSQGEYYHCTILTGPAVTIDFRGAGGKLLAVASVLGAGVSGPCNPIEFKVDGRSETPLLGGRFVPRVLRLLR